jgi:hypothetical protein
MGPRMKLIYGILLHHVELGEGEYLGGHGQLIVEGDHDGVLGLEAGHGGRRKVEEYLSNGAASK